MARCSGEGREGDWQVAHELPVSTRHFGAKRRSIDDVDGGFGPYQNGEIIAAEIQDIRPQDEELTYAVAVEFGPRKLLPSKVEAYRKSRPRHETS